MLNISSFAKGLMADKLGIKFIKLFSLTFSLFAFILLLAPTELLFSNKSAFSISYADLFKFSFPKILLYSFLTSLFLFLFDILSIKVKKYVSIFGIIQYVFISILLAIIVILWFNKITFNFDGLLNGDEWVNSFSFEAYLNNIICILIIIFSLILVFKNRKLFYIVPLIILFSTIVTDIFVLFNKQAESQTQVLSQAPDDLFKLSDNKKNIVFIVLDSFDGDVIDSIFQQEERLGNNKWTYFLKDFTYFDNYLPLNNATFATGASTFANKLFINQDNLQTYLYKEVYGKGITIWEILRDKGWNNILQRYVVYPKDPSLYSNAVTKGNYKFFATIEQLYSLYRLSFWKMTPFTWKNRSKKYYNFNIDNYSNVFDATFLKSLDMVDAFYTADNSTFALYHLHGTHIPYVVDENAKPSDNATEDSQAKASLLVASRIVEKIKKANLYDNTLIIITADHGSSMSFPLGHRAILFIKDYNKKNEEMQISHKPLYQLGMRDVLLNFADNDSFSIDDIPEVKERIYYYNLPNGNPISYEYMTAYKVDKVHAKDIDNFTLYHYYAPYDLTDTNGNRIDFPFGEFDQNNLKAVEGNSFKYDFPKDFDKIGVEFLADNWKREESGLNGKGVIRIYFKEKQNFKAQLNIKYADKSDALLDILIPRKNRLKIYPMLSVDSNDVELNESSEVTLFFRDNVTLKSIELIPYDK